MKIIKYHKKQDFNEPITRLFFILGRGENMGNRKGIPNKETRYDSDILPRLSDIKEWLMQGDRTKFPWAYIEFLSDMTTQNKLC